MHDAFAVRGVDPFGYLASDAKHVIDRHRPPGDPILERLAREVLHDQILDAGVRTHGLAPVSWTS